MCVFFALFIVTLFTASFTLGRYSSVENSEGDYSGDIEYVVSDQVVIYTVEDFYTAIKNGYSNIKIADSVQDPFIISGTVSEVRTDLTIDLNGHQIQRNSRLPLLQVVQNVYLTILDSKSGGSLYNPVGSVLQVSGGTLTIAAGAYESGPRGADSRNGEKADNYNEYVNTDGTTTPVGARIGNSATLQVTTNNAYQETSNQTVPIIIPSVDVDQEHVTVNGNMYFSTTGYSQNPTLIPADTYLYFTIDSDTVDNTTILSDAGGADYFYSYYLTETNSDGQVSYTYANPQQPGGNNVEVTVFIYNDVKDYITDDRSDHVRTSFAAIEIDSGNLYARNGDYYSYFGVNNTYCVDSEGGYMSVTQGDFYAYKNGVCVTCSTETATGEMLNISNGSFYSELGDTVRVDGGDMEVASGTFTKDVGNATATGYGAHGSVIDISGGELKVTTRATLNITGSGINGIYSHDGANSSVNVTNAQFNFNSTAGAPQSQYNCGINAAAGSVTCSNPIINIQYGTSNNTGIYSAGGGITCSGTTSLTIGGSYSAGIRAEGNSKININNQFKCSIDNRGTTLSSAAIIANGGTIGFNLDNSIAEQGYGITSTDLGIVAKSGANVNFISGSLSLTSTRGTSIYVEGGNITIGTEQNNSPLLDVTCQLGQNLHGGDAVTWDSSISATANRYNAIFVSDGSLKSYGTLNVEHVGVENDSVILDDGDNDTEWDPKNTAGNNAHIDAQRAYGNDGAQFSSDNLPIYNSTNAYYEFAIKSYAIRVEAAEGASSTVTITKGNIVNETRTFDDNGNQVEIDGSGGGGVYVSGGTVTLGQQGATAENDLSISATGTDAFAQYFHVTDAATNWSARLPRTGGHAVQVTGGELTINSGTYNSALGNGILLTNGNITVNDGTIVGGDHTYNSSQSSYDPCGAAASYCLKVCGGTININGGIFGSEPVLSNGNYVNSSVTSSGAFVMGTTTTSDGTTTINRGTANITKGTFNVYGQSAFAVYQHATVTFGKADGTGSDKDIFVRGFAAGLTVENSAESSIFVTIYNGEFRGFRNLNGDGIWFGNRYALTRIFGGQFIGETRYGLNIDNGGRLQISGGTYKGSQAGLWYGNGSAKLTIKGGQFTGTSKSGLYFDKNSWNNAEQKGNVQILGGVFAGVPVSQGRYEINRYYINGAIGAYSTGKDDGLGHDIQISDIIDKSNDRKIYFSNYQTMPGDNENEWDVVNLVENYYGYVRDRQKLNQTTCAYKYVKVST